MIAGLDGDGRAYAELLAAMGGYLRANFRRRLGAGSADVEDLVQETHLHQSFDSDHLARLYMNNGKQLPFGQIIKQSTLK